MADPAYTYGDSTTVKTQASVETAVPIEGETEGLTIDDTLIETCLVRADAFIEGEIGKAGLPLPSETTSLLGASANDYAIARVLLALFNNDEEKNEKVNDYFTQAQNTIDDYIEIELKKLKDSEEYTTDSYTISQSHKSSCYDLDQIIR